MVLLLIYPKSEQLNAFHSPGSLTAELTERSSPELSVFKRYFSKLAAAIVHPERLANELYAQDRVSEEFRKEVNTMGPSAYNRTMKLLSAIECLIELNPGTFHTFISVLREDSSLVYLADAMSDEYRK